MAVWNDLAPTPDLNSPENQTLPVVIADLNVVSTIEPVTPTGRKGRARTPATSAAAGPGG